MRSLSECTFNRVEYIKEIFKCIDRYSYDIDKEFSSLGCLGKLNKIDFNAGDTHNQGRMVISLTYTSGKKLLYKSRMLDIEKHLKVLNILKVFENQKKIYLTLN